MKQDSNGCSLNRDKALTGVKQALTGDAELLESAHLVLFGSPGLAKFCSAHLV